MCFKEHHFVTNYDKLEKKYAQKEKIFRFIYCDSAYHRSDI